MANEELKFEEYKSIKGIDVFEWCKENNQMDWLDEIANSTIYVYPKVEKNGKLVEDRTQEPTEERDITFIEIKKAFCEKFMPELLPVAKPKTPSLKDLIKAYKNANK